MEFLKYIWRPIEGLIFFECEFLRTYFDGREETRKGYLCGLPLSKNFSYRWTLDNEGWGEVCYVTVSHTPTGRKICATSTLTAARVLVDSLLLEADKRIDWDSSDLKQFGVKARKYLPKDFEDYVFWMSDTTEPVLYKNWEKSNG